MDRALATPEILHIVCSSLGIQDVRRFRQCCKLWSAIGACYAFQKIVFYLHKDDLDFLREISLNEDAARNVHEIVYIAEILETRKKTLQEYCHYYKTFLRALDKLLARSLDNGPPPPEIKTEQLKILYKKYEAQIDQQDDVLKNNYDLRALTDAVARFPSLQYITMSLEHQYHFRSKMKTPFDGCLVKPRTELMPKGCRHLDSLLSAVAGAGIKLKRLRAGPFSWKFFEKEPAALSKALTPCADLIHLELTIDTGTNDVPINQASDDDVGTEVPECRRVMEKGLLRDFIASLEALKTIVVQFDSHSKRHGYPAALRDVIYPGYRWEHLYHLSLSNIVCERQDLVAVLKKHKTSLKILELQDIRLRSTSWLVFLPQIRKTLRLDDAIICGELYGRNEYTGQDEKFDLEPPDCAIDDLRIAVTDYLCDGGRCPLTDRDNVLSEAYIPHD
ncbi:putative F-box domain-containing protein [Seiridium cardinale]|uniref:F-box domain-containing protein n=1 Tax=Seiridium cardinale TaxID=138064 RepID=A0ABR2XI87_9PEZI